MPLWWRPARAALIDCAPILRITTGSALTQTPRAAISRNGCVKIGAVAALVIWVDPDEHTIDCGELRAHGVEARSGLRKQSDKTFFPAPIDRQRFYSVLIVRIEQDSLYFIDCIDFAACDGEITFVGSRRQGISMVDKLNTPHEWLLEKARHWNADTLYEALSGVVWRLDGKSIQDLFQSEMGADGYFEQRPKSNAETLDTESWGSHRWHT